MSSSALSLSSIELEVTNPFEGEVYNLVVLDSNRHQQCITFKSPNGKTQIQSSISPICHLWLHVNTRDPNDGILTQLCLAWSYTEIVFSSKPNYLIDTRGKEQAIVRINCNASNVTPSSRVITSGVSDKIRSSVYSAYELVAGYEMDQFFVEVKTGALDLPLITFPILATQIRYDNSLAVDWFNQLLVVAKSELGISRIDETTPHNLCCELIGEIVTLPQRCQIFVNDYARERQGHGTGKIKKVPCDQWSRLNCYPNPELAGYDCEDGAHSVLEYLWVIKKMKISNKKTNKELIRLQQIIAQYTAFLAIGKIKVKNKYVPHAFVVMLAKQTGFTGLVIEPTNYMQSVWANENMLPATNFEAAQKWLSDDTNKRLLHCKADHESIINSKLYGDVAALLTASDEEAVHILCIDHMSHRVGVSLDDLMTGADNIEFQTAASLNRNEIESILQEAAELPQSQLPLPVPLALWESERKDRARADRSKRNQVRLWSRALGTELKFGEGLTVTSFHISERFRISISMSDLKQ